MTNSIKTYSDLIQLKTFEDRFNYLCLHGEVGKDTFGFDRYINQNFYKSDVWHNLRNKIIIRDNGCDLGIAGREIGGRIYIHHLNPIIKDDIVNATDFLLDPEYLICVSFDTHNAIHYGDERYPKEQILVERTKNDTCPWLKN